MSSPPLSQAVGYGIVLGVGFAFAIGMIVTTYCLRRYQKEKMTAEEFNTSGRTVKTGLIACAVVSSWTWAATLLQSTTQAYKNGISGPYWYASGATVQVVLFATLAIELKRKAPGAHTYLEVVRARFGTVAHFVFMFFAAACNFLVMAMLLAGAGATTNALTGMHPVAAMFLIPLGTCIYVLFGGLKATILSDYMHTIVLFVIMFLLIFTVYATNDYLGSPGRVWDLLTELAKTKPVSGNAEGSYLTMKSKSGGIFFVINIAGNFGTVFLDNGYWNKAIAASPSAALPGYLLGGIAWFAIPWVLATAMGLAGLCLENSELWPTYPQTMTANEVSSGLTLPYAAVALLGKGGGAASILLVFMAATSSASSEMVAVSSIVTYDIYKTYINRNAKGSQLMWVSHASVLGFTVFMVGISILFFYIEVSMGYLYLLMGVMICGAVIPASLTIFWSGLNKWSAILAPSIGFVCGLITWLVTTAGLFDSVIDVTTSGAEYPMLAGNLVSLLSPVIVITICQLVFGHAHFDFNDLKELQSVQDEDEDPDYNPDVEKTNHIHPSTSTATEVKWDAGIAQLNKYAKIAKYICCTLAVCLLVLWPMPMYGTGYVFSKPFFTGWVVVGFIWLFGSLFVVGVLPVLEGYKDVYHIFRGIFWDLTGQGGKLRAWQSSHPEAMHHGMAPVVSELQGVEVVRESAPNKKDDSVSSINI